MSIDFGANNHHCHHHLHPHYFLYKTLLTINIPIISFTKPFSSSAHAVAWLSRFCNFVSTTPSVFWFNCFLLWLLLDAFWSQWLVVEVVVVLVVFWSLVNPLASSQISSTQGTQTLVPVPVSVLDSWSGETRIRTAQYRFCQIWNLTVWVPTGSRSTCYPCSPL